MIGSSVTFFMGGVASDSLNGVASSHQGGQSGNGLDGMGKDNAWEVVIVEANPRS